jgi:hypothetical protein
MKQPVENKLTKEKLISLIKEQIRLQEIDSGAGPVDKKDAVPPKKKPEDKKDGTDDDNVLDRIKKTGEDLYSTGKAVYDKFSKAFQAPFDGRAPEAAPRRRGRVAGVGQKDEAEAAYVRALATWRGNKSLKNAAAVNNAFEKLPADSKHRKAFNDLVARDSAEKSTDDKSGKSTGGKPPKRRRGRKGIFLRRQRDLQSQFIEKYGPGIGGFKNFYKDLEKAGKIKLLGRRGKDYQFGPAHQKAFQALLDKTDDGTKDKKDKNSKQDKSKKGGSFLGQFAQDIGAEAGRSDKKSAKKEIELRARGYEPYKLPREDYKFMIGLIKKDPSIQMNQIRSRLRKAGKRNHTYQSVVKVKLRQAMKKYSEKAMEKQDDEFDI